MIPVYLGAPDIEEFVPADAFVNVRDYKDWDSLFNKIKDITETEAIEMINKGREFLETPPGRLHSFEGFASFMEGLIVQECQTPLPDTLRSSLVDCHATTEVVVAAEKGTSTHVRTARSVNRTPASRATPSIDALVSVIRKLRQHR